MTTIKLKNGSGAPTAGDLAQGEPALDLTNKRLYTEDSGGTVIEVGTNPTSITTGDITATGTASFANLATTGNITFGDNDKAVFGAGSDLQIYHSGSHSFISEAGTGDLYIGASSNIALMNSAFSENKLLATTDGALKLYYDGSQKLATTSTGIDVTGTLVSDGLTVDGATALNNTSAGTTVATLSGQYAGSGDVKLLAFQRNGGAVAGAITYADASTGMEIGTTTSHTLALTTGDTQRLRIGNGGDISFYEDTGTTAKFEWDSSEESLTIGGGSTTQQTLRVTGAHASALSTGFDNQVVKVVNTSASKLAGIDFVAANTNGDAGTIARIGGFNTSSASYLGEITLSTRDGTGMVERVRIDDSGNVGIGTTSPVTFGAGTAGLTVNGSTSHITWQNSGTNVAFAYNNGNDFIIGSEQAGSNTIFTSAGSQRMRIDSSGNVGIGTTAPREKIHLHGGISSTQLLMTGGGLNSEIYGGFIEGDGVSGQGGHLRLGVLDAGTERVGIEIEEQGNQITFDTAGIERMRIDSSGNAQFDNNGGTTGKGRIQFGNSGQQFIEGLDTGNGGSGAYLRFGYGSTEAMRIDSSGNLLVGTTDTTLYNNTTGGGAMLSNSGCGFAKETSGAGDPVAYFNNTGDDGQILDFRKDGSTVGNINTAFGYIAVGTGDTGISFRNDLDSINPFTITGNTNRDAAIDLGASGTRFKDLYLSGTAYASALTTTNSGITLQSSSVTKSAINVAATTNQGINGTAAGDQYNWTTGGKMLWSTNSGTTAHMILDGSGNLLVGKTSTNIAVAGCRFGSFGAILTRGDGAEPLRVNRTSSDGDVIKIDKDGTTVGTINTNAGAFVFKGASASAPVQLQTHDGNEDIEVDPDGFIKMETAGSERLRIDASGNVLVGTTDTSLYNNTSGDGIKLGSSGEMQVANTNDVPLWLNRMGTDGGIVNLRKAGVEVGSISVTSSATSYNTSSDQRLKDNIVDAPSASDDIDAIQVRSFDWKADGSHQKYGMVAQELQSVAPEAVSGDADSEDMMGVDYSKLVPMMMKEIQSLRARVAQLEGEN